MKLPFMQEARRFEKRLLVWDGDPNPVPTKGRGFIWVDTTARWRIADAKKFLEDVASEAVYERMISLRRRIAAQFRSEGEGRSAEILGTMEKELRQIRSTAYRRCRRSRAKPTLRLRQSTAMLSTKVQNSMLFCVPLKAARRRPI